jgi:iron-sulfur cluster repair protein YtfE (RIC family)
METEMQNEHFKTEMSEMTHRFNIYAGIHKAVRAFLCDTLGRVATLDIADRQEIAHTIKQLRELLAFCSDHIVHEDRFVHPAMERRQPGSSADTAEGHLHHAQALASLIEAGDALEHGSPNERPDAWNRLHRELAVFVGENLLHMDVEESANNQVLQSCYSDGELVALHQEILAALTPQEMATATRWMMIGSSPAERAQAMAGMRADAPPPAFEAMLDIARDSLSPGDWNKLAAALALAPVAIAA